MKKFAKVLLVLCMLVMTSTVFAACGAPKITSLRITGVPQYVTVGQEFTLQAILTPAKASQKDVVWSSSDSTKAVVNEFGKVTPLSLGTVIITAASKKDATKKDHVTIEIKSTTSDIMIENFTTTYDGTPKSVSVKYAPAGMKLKYTYKLGNAEPTETPPANAGVYTVSVYQEGSNIVEAQCILRINPREVTINIDDKSKVFGAQEPSYTSSISGLVGIDTLEYTVGRIDTLEDVGRYKITATTHQVNPNYTVLINDGTLEIIPRDVKIVPHNKTSIYGDPLAQLTFDIQDLAGNVLSNIDQSNVAGTLKISTNGNLEKLSVGSYTITSSNLISTNLNIRENATATYKIEKRTAYVAVTANQGKFAGAADPVIEKVISNTVEGDDLSQCLYREEGELVGFYQYLLDNTINTNYKLVFTTASIFSIRSNQISIAVESFSMPYSPTQAGSYIPADKLKYIVTFNGVSNYATMDGSGYIILQGIERVFPSVELQQVASLTEIEKQNIYQKWKMTPSLISSENIIDDQKYEYTFEETHKFITKLDLIVTAKDASKFYKDEDPTFEFTLDGLVGNDTVSVAQKMAFTRDKTGNSEDVGTYEIFIDKKALQDGKDYYKPTFVGATFTILKRPIYITPISYTEEDGNAVYYGEPEKELNYDTTDSNLPNSCRLSDVFTGTLTRGTGTSVGIYDITIKNLEVTKNFELVFTPGKYQIIPRPWYITVQDKTITYGESASNFLYNSEPYKGPDGSAEYILSKPIINGKPALTKNQTLYANDLTDANPNNDYYEIGQGNLTAGPNFTILFTSGKLTVTKRQVTLSFISQSYEYGTERPALSYAFSPALANGDTVKSLDYLEDNSVNSKVFTLKNVDGSYQYSIEFQNSNGKLVNDCYDVSINEQAVELYVVGASLLQIEVISKQDITTSTSTVTYGDIFAFTELFDLRIKNNVNNYSLQYTDASFISLTGVSPINAGSYTIAFITNPADANVVKVLNAGGEDISENFALDVEVRGILNIEKANLTLLSAPTVQDMEYGSEYPSIINAIYTFDNARTGETEIYSALATDYTVADYSASNVRDVPYIIRAIYNPTSKNFNPYTHDGLELTIIKKELSTDAVTWMHGQSFDTDGVDDGEGTITVTLEEEVSPAVYQSAYVASANDVVIPASLDHIKINVAYVYKGFFFSSDATTRGQLPYKNSESDFGYVSVGNDYTYKAELKDGVITFYYIGKDEAGNEKIYKLDDTYLEISSTAPTRAGIYYVTARVSTTDANYTFNKQDFASLYVVHKSAATIYFAEAESGVTYNTDGILNLTFTSDITGAEVKTLGYKYYPNGTDHEPEDFVGTPTEVGNYIVIVEVDSENFYKKSELGFVINQAILEVAWGSNTNINFRESTGQSVDFVLSVNGITLFTFKNGSTNNGEIEPLNNIGWIEFEFSDGTNTSKQLPVSAGTYTLTISVKADGEGVNYKTATLGGETCAFIIIPKIYSGSITFQDATINYDVTYERENGHIAMYETIKTAMVRDPHGEILDEIAGSGIYNIQLFVNNGLEIGKVDNSFVPLINQAGRTFEIKLVISDPSGNVGTATQTAILTVQKSNMPTFNRYSTTVTKQIDFTGQRIFNPLTDTSGNIYTPTIYNEADKSWTYAEKGDAELFFGITYRYYNNTDNTILADAPITMPNNVTIQFKVVAEVTAGANYNAPAIPVYEGLFTIAKTNFSFDRNDISEVTYTYGYENAEVDAIAINSAGDQLILKYVGVDTGNYTVEDGIVCLRKYRNNDSGTEYTSLPTAAGEYTVSYKIVSDKSMFKNADNASDFETTKTLIINPRQIDCCDQIINIASNPATPNPALLYSRQIKTFGYKTKATFPDHLKELFGASTTPNILFNLYREDGTLIVGGVLARNLLSTMKTQDAGNYLFTLSPSSNTNFCESEKYPLVIHRNAVTLSFITGAGNTDVHYDSDTGIYSQTVGYTASENPFDVTKIKVTGRLSSSLDNSVLGYSDYVVRYKRVDQDYTYFTTDIPVTQGIYDVEIVLRNGIYQSPDRDINEDPATAETLPLQLVYEIYAPTLTLSVNNNNYTYKDYSTDSFIINAYYGGTSRGSFNAGVHTGGTWILNQDQINAGGITVTYQGDATPTNIDALIASTLAEAQAYDPSIRLSTIEEFNNQNVGAYTTYVMFISDDLNFAPTIGQITFNVSPKLVTVNELSCEDEHGAALDDRLTYDSVNNKFVYTVNIVAEPVFQSNTWSFEPITYSGPTNTRFRLKNPIDGVSDILEANIRFTTLNLDSTWLYDQFEAGGQGYTISYTLTTLTAIAESTGNFEFAMLDTSPVGFEYVITISKGAMPNVFTITNIAQPYDTYEVYAEQFTNASQLAFSNFVSFAGSTTSSPVESEFKYFNAAYNDPSETFDAHITFFGFFMQTATGDNIQTSGNVTLDNPGKGSKINKTAQYATYKIVYDIPESIFFSATKLNIFYTVEPKGLTAKLDRQILDGSGLPSIQILDGDAEVDYQATVKITLADETETLLLYTSKRTSGTTTTNTDIIAGAHTLIAEAAGNTTIFAVEIELTSLGDGIVMDNITLNNHLEGEDRTTIVYLLYVASSTDLGSYDLYGTIDNRTVLSNILGQSDPIKANNLINNLGLSIEWSTGVQSALELSNYMVTESVVSSFVVPDDLGSDDSPLPESPDGTCMYFEVNIAQYLIDNDTNIYPCSNLVVYIVIGEDKIPTNVSLDVSFGITLDVTDTIFTYTGETQAPTAALKLYAFNYRNEFRYKMVSGSPQVDAEGNKIIEDIVDILEPVYIDCDNTTLQVVYKKGGSIVANPKDAGEYQAIYTYTVGSKTYSQVIPFTIKAEVVEVVMANQEFDYDGSAHTLTATATKDGHPLNIKYSYFNSAGTPLVASQIKDAGTYRVEAYINEPNYEGYTYAILTIRKLATNIQVTPLSAADSIYRPSTTFAPTYKIYDASGRDITQLLKDDGAVTVTYKLRENGSYGSTAPNVAGTFKIKIAVTGSTNYFDSTLEYTYIISKAITSISYTLPTSVDLVYDGEAKEVTNVVAANGTATTVTYNGATTAPKDVGLYKVVITSTSTDNYEACEVVDYFEITPQALAVTYDGYELTTTVEVDYVDNLELSYTANCDQTVTYAGFKYNDDGELETTVTSLGSNQPTTPGVYTATHKAVNSNYEGTIVYTIKINRVNTTFAMTGFMFTYNKAPQTPGVTATVADYTVTYTGSTYNGTEYNSTTAPTDAGMYTATLVFEGNALYLPQTTSAVFTINKAAVELTLEDIVTTYDGTAKAPTVVAKIDGVVDPDFTNYQIVYSDQTVDPIDAGTYTVYAYSTDNNYVGVSSQVLFSISPADVIITLVKADGKFTYGDTETIIETINVPHYKILYSGKSYLSDGSLPTEDNYNVIDHIPTLAGEYKGKVISSNYKPFEFTFSIEKVSVAITMSPMTITVGQFLQLSDKIGGYNVEYTFAFGATDYGTTKPTQVGVYTMTATIKEQNHQGTATAVLTIAPITTGQENYIHLSQPYFMYTGDTINIGAVMYVGGAVRTPDSTEFVRYHGGGTFIETSVKNIGQYQLTLKAGLVTLTQTFEVIPEINLEFPTNAIYTGETFSVNYRYVNSSEQSYEVTNNLSLIFNLNGKFTSSVRDAGTYTVYLLYKNSIVKQQSFEVQKQTVSLPTAKWTKTFGEEFPSKVGPYKVTYQFSTNGGVTYTDRMPTAGNGYKLLIVVDEKNYQGTQEVDLDIAKAQLVLDFGEIVCDYTGTAIVLPTSYQGITGINYTFSTQPNLSSPRPGTPTEPGEYYVTASISEANYSVKYPGTDTYIKVTINAVTPNYVVKDLIHTYDGTAKAVNASVVINGRSARVRIVYSTASPTDVGDYTVTLSVEGDTHYLEQTYTMTILPATPTITYTLPSNLTYEEGVSKEIIDATSSSGSAVTVTYKKDGSDANPISAGNYVATLSCPAVGNYAAAEVFVAFTINKAMPEFSYGVDSINYLTYDESVKKYDMLYDPAIVSVNAEYRLSGTLVANPTEAGTYTVKFIITAIDPNYASYVVETKMIINKAYNTITYSNPSTMYVDGGNKKLTGLSASSGGTVNDTYKINGNTATDFTVGGTYTATLTVSSSANYLSNSIVVVYEIAKRDTQISISSLLNVEYDGAPHEVVINNPGIISSGYYIQYTGKYYDVDGSTLKDYNSRTAPTNAGVYTAELKFDNANYYTTSQVSKISFSISKKVMDITITLSGLEDTISFVEFDGTIYTTGTRIDNAVVNAPTLEVTTTLNGSTASQISEGGEYSMVVQVNSQNHIGYSQRTLLITKKQAFIYLRSSAINYGETLAPQYTLRDENGETIVATNVDPQVVLYDSEGNEVDLATTPDTGEYSISIVINSSGYMASGLFPFTIRPAQPKLYYIDETGATPAFIELSTEVGADNQVKGLKLNKLCFSVDGTTESNLLFNAAHTSLLANVSIIVTYSTIEDGDIVTKSLDVNSNLTNVLPARVYNITIRANTDLANANFNILEHTFTVECTD